MSDHPSPESIMQLGMSFWASKTLLSAMELELFTELAKHPERRENAFGLLMSLNMLIETEDGFDYTGADCRGWMADAGFRESRVEHLVGPDSMVIGIK